MFHKKRGMKETDMSPSPWVYRQLKRFRAGIEAGISYLKRCFGLGLFLNPEMMNNINQIKGVPTNRICDSRA